MKKITLILVSALICVCVFLSGCTGTYDKAPNEYSKIRWYAPDYSFIIKPDEDCAGSYKFGEKKYNIKAQFNGSNVSIVDTDNKNTELFNAQWTYEDEDKLYIYNIMFNTKDYKEFESNYSEFVRLNQEKLK